MENTDIFSLLSVILNMEDSILKVEIVTIVSRFSHISTVRISSLHLNWDLFSFKMYD